MARKSVKVPVPEKIVDLQVKVTFKNPCFVNRKQFYIGDSTTVTEAQASYLKRKNLAE